MSIGDWFKARESRKYTNVARPEANIDVPGGVWSNCASCKHIIYQGELTADHYVCRYCGHHFDLTALQRIESLVDGGTFFEVDSDLTAADPLQFHAAKSYADSLSAARERSGMNEAVLTGRAMIGGHPVVVGAMDFRFVGASMGSVVGEKVTRAFELALAERRAMVFATASGGARMQEGMLSLMQMAKTSAAAARLAEERLPYVSILTNPTMGGVTASFAVLADVMFAEPGALIGFAGPRVIEQTIRQKLPKGFQSSEFLLAHGMVDDVVPRSGMSERVALTLDYLMSAVAPAPSVSQGGERL
ncbi:MAG: acetyl-CoA carboxylase, carboxyltransferase subunit beta [Actinomycetota bacterium]|nr:acetyl-CoA carboxylase, carboxyltransferase subunit beta [Actinomycetota bacterium]MDZ4180298.1 acetyl-CoA carboxylase, carboxyltransferase subunit beta [Coriobacteriia bacterium]